MYHVFFACFYTKTTSILYQAAVKGKQAMDVLLLAGPGFV